MGGRKKNHQKSIAFNSSAFKETERVKKFLTSLLLVRLESLASKAVFCEMYSNYERVA